MTQYKLTNQAVVDLNGIWEYTFVEWSEQQADKYYNSLLESCEEIATNPNLGRNYQGIREDLFAVQSNKHIIFYRIIDENLIEITRILHQSMDIESRFKE